MGKTEFQNKLKIAFVRDAILLTRDYEMNNSNNPENMPIYDDVEEQLNIAYMNRDEVPLAMDIFKPKVADGTELPVIVTIHGGGLTMGDRRLSRPFGRLLAHKGYLTFSIEYRLVPQANVCQELDDICAGLDIIGRMLVNYDVDFTRIYIAAESAGAYLATYVTAMRGSKKLQDAIGYKPGKLIFKAIGLMSGMIYTNRNDPCGWVLKDQIYGEKRMDESFLELMDPENPEIINNLPPVYLITSRGDFVNHYSIMMNEALKKAGKPCHLLYYGDINLKHAFTTMQMDDPRSIEAVDKMLAWFEEQVACSAKKEKEKKQLSRKMPGLLKKLADGTMDAQPVWSYVKERAKTDPDRMSMPAIIDCTRTYTYAQMFSIWNQYARVFSALEITGRNHSRVGVAGAITAEPLFAFYGLNMTGAEVSMFSYPDFLPGGRWKTMVEKEHITDLIITDVMVTPQMWYEIEATGKELGLRNIILVHSLMGGPCVGPSELVFNEFNYHALQRLSGTVFLDELLEKYADFPIEYGNNTGESIALITHTSGSTKGTRKPLPYTNRAVNALASALTEGYSAKFITRMSDGRRPRIAPSYDMSSFANIAGLANTNLATGKTLVLTFFGFIHPKFVRAISYYKLDMILTTSFMLDNWMKLAETEEMDFSSLKVLGIGGAFLPLDKLEKYKQFLKEHGYKYDIIRGYGMSEAGNAKLYVPSNCPEDILGYPAPPEDFYVLDDTDKKLYCVSEGERTGVMYVTSKSMCENVLDGVELFPLTEIKGRNFVCTNDKVRVNADGSLSYAGRMDKFFVNNDGVRFEAGIVEKKISELACVAQLALVPVLDKRIHDTVPVLYVQPADETTDITVPIATQLEKAYKEEKELIGTALPSQLVKIDTIPCTATGKVDTYRINRERCAGKTWNIVPSYNSDGSLKSVHMEEEKNISTIKAGSLPQGMGKDSAMGLFEIFNSSASPMPQMKEVKEATQRAMEQRNNIQAMLLQQAKDMIFTMIPDNIKKEIGFENGKISKPSDKLVNAVMELQGIQYRHDTIDHDFED